MTINDIYDRYWTSHGFQPPSNQNKFLDAAVAESCVPGRVVADLGCGDARTIGDRAVRAGTDYIGIDISRSAVASATSRGLDVRRVEDISATGLDSESVDSVFIIEVLEHLLDPESAILEARRLLRRGGRLFITVPNSAVWPRRAELALRGRPNGMGDDLSRDQPWRDPHIRFFTVRSLRDLLATCGFESAIIGGAEPVPHHLGERAVTLRPSVFARRVTATATR